MKGPDSVAALAVAPQGSEAFEPLLPAVLAGVLAMVDVPVDLEMCRRLATSPAVSACRVVFTVLASSLGHLLIVILIACSLMKCFVV